MKTCDAQYAVICTYSAADKKGAIVRTSETSRPHHQLVPSDHSFTTMFARRVFYKRAPGASKKSFSTGAEEPKSAVGKAVAFVSKNRQQLVNMYVSSTTLHKHIQLVTTYIIYLAHCPYLLIFQCWNLLGGQLRRAQLQSAEGLGTETSGEQAAPAGERSS